MVRAIEAEDFHLIYYITQTPCNHLKLEEVIVPLQVNTFAILRDGKTTSCRPQSASTDVRAHCEVFVVY